MVKKITGNYKKRCLDETIGFFDFAEADGYIWAAAINYNALFKIDKETMIPTYVGSFPGESMYQIWLYRSVVCVGKRLIFAPFMAECIGEYDLENEQFIEHERIKQSGIRFKFESIIAKDDKVYLMPQRYPEMMVYDTKSGSVAYKNCLKKALAQDGEEIGTVFWGVGTIESDKCIYIPQRGASDIVRFEFDRDDAEKIDIRLEGSYLICSLIDGWLWLLPSDSSPLVKCNVENGEKVIYSDLTIELEEEGAPFIRAIDCGEKICFIREMSKKTLLYDKSNDLFENIELRYEATEEIIEKPWKGNFYFAKKVGQNEILAVSKKDHGVVIFDVDNMQMQSFRFCMSDTDRKMWSTNALLRGFEKHL